MAALRKVICSEPSSTRREEAKLAGAHHLFSPLETDIVAEVRKLTGSDSGVDLAFEAAANERALVTAIKAVKTRGTVLNVSVWSREPRIPMNELVFSEKAILGASCCESSNSEVFFPQRGTDLGKVLITLLANPDADRDDHPAVMDALSSGSIKLERKCRGCPGGSVRRELMTIFSLRVTVSRVYHGDDPARAVGRRRVPRVAGE